MFIYFSSNNLNSGKPSMCAESIAGIEQVGDINELLKVAMAYGA